MAIQSSLWFSLAALTLSLTLSRCLCACIMPGIALKILKPNRALKAPFQARLCLRKEWLSKKSCNPRRWAALRTLERTAIVSVLLCGPFSGEILTHTEHLPRVLFPPHSRHRPPSGPRATGGTSSLSATPLLRSLVPTSEPLAWQVAPARRKPRASKLLPSEAGGSSFFGGNRTPQKWLRSSSWVHFKTTKRGYPQKKKRGGYAQKQTDPNEILTAMLGKPNKAYIYIYINPMSSLAADEVLADVPSRWLKT